MLRVTGENMRRRVIASLLAAVLMAAAILVATHSNNAHASQPPQERFTFYQRPVGTELTPQVAVERGIQHILNLEGGAKGSALGRTLAMGTTTVEVAHSNFATALAVQEGQPASAATTRGSDAEQTEWRESQVYVMVANGQFAPAVPEPRGRVAPEGHVISLIVDAHTGFVMALQLGGVPPTLEQLGAVSRLTVGAGATVSGGTAERLNPRDGVLVGNVYQAGKPVAGWPVVARRGHYTVSTKTTASGGFAFRLLPGEYIVKARSPSGTPCGRRHERVIRRHNTYVTLQCK